MRVETQVFAPGVHPQVEDEEHELHRDETRVVDHHQQRPLFVLYGIDDGTARQTHPVAEAEQLVHDHREEELQGVHEEQHDKEQDGGHPDREAVLHPVAPEVLVVAVPHGEEQQEADREREEPAHRHEQIVEGSGHLEGDDEQRYREREDRI